MCEHITPISYYSHRHLYKEDLELEMDIFMRIKNFIVSASNSAGYRGRMRGWSTIRCFESEGWDTMRVYLIGDWSRMRCWSGGMG